MGGDEGDSAARAGSTGRTHTRKPGAGRRRDPAIDDRLRRAARILYAREGWAGFHFEGIARAAAVSKDAVYRRYPDAQSLLLDALSDQGVPTLADDLPVEQALIDYACDAYAFFVRGDGYANLRVHIDAAQYPDVMQQYRVRVVEPQLRQAIAILEDARADGRLHPDTSCTAVVEALGGAVMVHALASVPWPGGEDCPDVVLDDATLRQLTEFVQQILHGRLTGHSVDTG